MVKIILAPFKERLSGQSTPRHRVLQPFIIPALPSELVSPPLDSDIGNLVVQLT